MPLYNPAAGSGGLIVPDASITLGSFYARSGGYLYLKPQTTWLENIADAKANAPGGWTWEGTANLVSASTSGGVLTGAGSTSATYVNSSSVPRLFKTYSQHGNHFTVIARVRSADMTTANKYFGLMVSSSSAVWVGMLLRNAGGASAGIAIGNQAGQTHATATAQQASDGVWLMITIAERSNAAEGVHFSYNFSTSATPPTSGWTTHATAYAVPGGATWNPFQVGFAWLRVAGDAGGMSGDVLYYDDSGIGLEPYGSFASNVACATGCDGSAAAVTLVSSWDVGTSSLSDSTIQAMLGNLANTRSGETASWTFSAVRGSSPNPAAGSYAAAASVTVSGSGPYFALYGKCSSAARAQTGSLFLPELRIPY